MEGSRPEVQAESPEPGTGRIEAFSDGVLAIVITLLVLEIKVPLLRESSSAAETWSALAQLWPMFLSLILSFAFVALFWVNHDRFFHMIRWADRGLIWLNNLLLLFLCFIRFPTALIGEYPRDRVALCVFAIVLAAAGTVFNFMWRHSRRRGFLRIEVAPAAVKNAIRRGLAGPVLYAVAAAGGFLSPAVA